MARYARSLPEVPAGTPVFPNVAEARGEFARMHGSRNPYPNTSQKLASPVRPKKGRDGFAVIQDAIVRCLTFKGAWRMDTNRHFSTA